MGSERRQAIIHVLRKHVDKSRVPHGCNLCGYKCDSFRNLKGHRTRYSPHLNAFKKATARGEQINEDKMEYHSGNPVKVDNLIEKVENGKSALVH